MSAVKNHARKSGLPSPEQVREVLSYDGSELIWRISRSRARAGAIAGCIRKCDGYRQVKVGDANILAHRVIWAIVHGEWPDKVIDHINGNKLDNRVENLRLATDSQNSANSRVSRNNLLGVKGVYKNPSGKYVAQKGANGRVFYLGCYDTVEEAHEAFRKKSVEIHGEFANFG